MELIFELKLYNDEKGFKLASLKMQGYASLWYENLKRNIARKLSSISKYGPNSRSIWTGGPSHPPICKSFTSRSHLKKE